MKTVLIGLGGFGCRAVSADYERIDRGRIVALGFDRDPVDYERIKSKNELPMFYIEPYDPTVPDSIPGTIDWFPLDKNGAFPREFGMENTRASGRLCVEMCCDRLGGFLQFIEKEAVTGHEPETYNVIIVTSLAGSTGSGAALPLALRIKERFLQIGKQAKIYGLFILPETILDLWPGFDYRRMTAMYANAYAAIKEIRTINRICLSDVPPALKGKVSVGDLFDSERDAGDSSKIPFDCIRFFRPTGDVSRDPEKLDGELADFVFADSTSSALREAVYYGDMTRIYDPVGWICRTAGVSKTVYPAREIVEYCGTRAVIDALNGRWLAIDRELGAANAENGTSAGPSAEEDERRDRFLASFNEKLEEEGSGLSFLKDHVSYVSEDGRRVNAADAYLEKLSAVIRDAVGEDRFLSESAEKTDVTEDMMKEDPAGTAVRCEIALDEYFRAVELESGDIAHEVAKTVIPLCGSEEGFDGDGSVADLLSRNGDSVHPLAARALLYRFRKLVTEKSEENKNARKALLEEINGYFMRSENGEKADHVKAAGEKAERAKLFKRTKFRKEYLTGAKEQKERIGRYCESEVTGFVFRFLSGRLEGLIRQYETLFENLDGAIEDLRRDVDAIEKKIADAPGKTYYVGSSDPELKALYDSLDKSFADSGSRGAYSAVSRYLYDRFVRTHTSAGLLSSPERETERSGEEIKSLLRKAVVEPTVSEFAERFPEVSGADLFDAMEKTTGGDRSGEEQIIARALKAADPFDEPELYQWAFGIVSPGLFEHLDLLGALPTFRDGMTLFEDASVPDNEAYFMKEKCGVSLGSIAGPSSFARYREAYRMMTESYRKTGDRFYCPHIDKRWCEEGALLPVE